MDKNITTIKLSDGSEALVQIYNNESREQQVAFFEKKFDIKDLQSSIKSLTKDIIQPFSDIKVDKIKVEMGLNIGIKSGKITSLLVNGNLDTAMKVTVEWINTK